MALKKTLSVKIVLLSLLFLSLLLGIGYKFFEWDTINKLSKLNSETVPEELLIVEKSNKNSGEVVDLFVDLFSEENKSLGKQLDLYEKLDGKSNLAIDYSEEYLDTLEKNRKKFKKIEFASNLLIGKRRELARQFLINQIKYYDEEIEVAKEGVISDYLAKNMFSIMKDKTTMMDFEEIASAAPETNYSYYFADIASLEKYTRSDYKLPKEDEIKNLYPYGHEMLINNKDYMEAYYSVVKDYVGGDYESAAYKFSRIEETYLELNIDFDRLFSEGEERKNKRAKKIIEYVVAKNKAIKEFERSNLGVYPSLPKINGWKDNLELCQLYSYKAALYNNILKKYPDAEDFEGLVEELAQLSPSTTSVDSDFDKETINFTNTDEVIQFECTDREADKTYTFVTKK